MRFQQNDAQCTCPTCQECNLNQTRTALKPNELAKVNACGKSLQGSPDSKCSWPCPSCPKTNSRLTNRKTLQHIVTLADQKHSNTIDKCVKNMQTNPSHIIKKHHYTVAFGMRAHMEEFLERLPSTKLGVVEWPEPRRRQELVERFRTCEQI